MGTNITSANFNYKDFPHGTIATIQIPNNQVEAAYNNGIIPYATAGRLLIWNTGRCRLEFHTDNDLTFEANTIFGNITSNSEINWYRRNTNKRFYEFLIQPGAGHKLNVRFGTFDHDIGTEGFLMTGCSSYIGGYRSLIFFSLSRQGVVPFFHNLVTDCANLQITNVTNGWEIENKGEGMVTVSFILTREMGMIFEIT